MKMNMVMMIKNKDDDKNKNLSEGNKYYPKVAQRKAM